jgi:hypothetical protein
LATADRKNTKFKVGDEVIRTNQPFELREIIKQLPAINAGECQYRIGPLRKPDGTTVSGGQRDVRENELMRLDEVLDELLDLAEAKRDGATKNALLAALCCARIDYDRSTKKLPPAKDVRKLRKSVVTTRNLLAKLTEYDIPREIEFHTCEIGAGVVDVLSLPFKVPETFKVFQLSPRFEGTAMVMIQNLLRSWHDRIKEVPTKKREGQRKGYKTAIVERAAQFSCQHSNKKPSTNPSNPFHEFVEQFYKRVVGTKPDRSLEYHVREALSVLRLEIDRSKS